MVPMLNALTTVLSLSNPVLYFTSIVRVLVFNRNPQWKHLVENVIVVYLLHICSTLGYLTSLV